LSDVGTAQELKRLRYGTTISTVNLPVWVAKESRLFAKYGLDPEVIMIQAGALTTLAIISGELQFSGAGAASVLAARIKGGDIALGLSSGFGSCLSRGSAGDKERRRAKRKIERGDPSGLDDSFLSALGAQVRGP